MYLLLSLAAGLVGCFYINCLDKLSESVRGKLRKFAVSLYPLDKLFQILCLSFLFFNNLLQTYDLSLMVFKNSKHSRCMYTLQFLQNPALPFCFCM